MAFARLKPEKLLGVWTRPEPVLPEAVGMALGCLYFKFQSHGKVKLYNAPYFLCTHCQDLAQDVRRSIKYQVCSHLEKQTVENLPWMRVN